MAQAVRDALANQGGVVTVVTQGNSGTSTDARLARLNELADLKAKGVLSEAEFVKLKAEILSSR